MGTKRTPTRSDAHRWAGAAVDAAALLSLWIGWRYGAAVALCCLLPIVAVALLRHRRDAGKPPGLFLRLFERLLSVLF